MAKATFIKFFFIINLIFNFNNLFINFRIYPFNGKAITLLIQIKFVTLPQPPFRDGLRNGRFVECQQNVYRPLLSIPYFINPNNYSESPVIFKRTNEGLALQYTVIVLSKCSGWSAL